MGNNFYSTILTVLHKYLQCVDITEKIVLLKICTSMKFYSTANGDGN